jgi:hypothetical protein
MSMTVIAAPVSLINSKVAMPIGPAPMIKTLSWAPVWDRWAAWQPIAKVSTNANWSMVNFEDTWSLSARMRNLSHNPPSLMTPMTFKFAQQLLAPLRQA